MTNEEKIREGNYRRCIAYAPELDPNTESRLRRLATENRLVINEWADDIDYLTYSGVLKKDTEVVLIEDCSALGEGYEYYWRKFLIGGRKLDLVVGNKEVKAYDEITDYFVERELDIRVKRLKAGKKRRVEAGYHIGKAPFGYYVEQGKLKIDPYESFVVKFMFYRRENGAAYHAICKELNDRGYKSKAGHYFEDMTVKRIVDKKKFYQGYALVNGEYIEGKHPAILGRDELLSEEFKKKVCDEITSKRLMSHRKRINERAVPQKVNANYYSGRKQEKVYRKERE